MANVQSPLLSGLVSLTAAGEKNDVANEYGKLRSFNTAFEVEAAQLALDNVVMLGPLPTGAVVLQIWLASDELDTNGTPTLTWDVGIYENADDDTETKDEDVYASAITVGQDATPFTDYAFEARDIAVAGQKVWEDAGDAEDDNETYYLGAKVATAPATAAAGSFAVHVVYAVE